MVLDFDEIQGHQRFEVMVSQFLRILGYEVTSGPGVGPDGGKDMIAIDRRDYGGVRFLVSCKYKLQRSGSVCYNSEGKNGGDHCDIHRIRENGCHGFLCAYSTDVSQPLLNHILEACGRHDYFPVIFRGADLEREMLLDSNMYGLIRQYMPITFQKVSSYIASDTCENCKSYTLGNVYLLPYLRPSMDVGFVSACDYCIHHRMDGTYSSSPTFGEPIVIHRDPTLI